MFEELEEEGVDLTHDSPDRALAWAIWSRSESNNLTAEEAWAILHERYPSDARFLLLNAYAELSTTRKHSETHIKAARAGGGPGATVKVEAGVWTPSYFLKKVERILGAADADLHPRIRELVVFGWAILSGAKDEDARLLGEVRSKMGAEGEAEPKRDDRDRAGLRLRRFEREVLKELDERTQDNKPLGTRAPPPAAPDPGKDWAAAVADASKERRRYAADGRFAPGELVEHPKFGVGLVTGTEPGKAVILFESGIRKLVAGA